MFCATRSLIENLMSIEDQKRFALAVLKAQDVREDSFNKRTVSYSKNEFISANEVVATENLPDYWGSIIGSLNYYYWNDVQSWALGD